MNNRTNLLTLLTALCLALLATSCGSKTDAGASDADSTTTTEKGPLKDGPLKDVMTFYEKQAEYALAYIEPGSSRLVSWSGLQKSAAAAKQAVGEERLKALETELVGIEIPTEIENDDFQGSLHIDKIYHLNDSWDFVFSISFAEGEEHNPKHAPLVFCDSNGDPIHTTHSGMRRGGNTIRTEVNFDVLRSEKNKMRDLTKCYIWKHICKVKVVTEEAYAEYEQQVKERLVEIESIVGEQLIQRASQDAPGEATAAKNGETKGALAALDLQGPVSQCTWKQHYRTETYGFTQGGKLSTYGGKPAQKAFTEVEYDAKGRLEHTQLENAEYYTYENTGYAYDANGRVKAIDYNDGEGYTNSAFTRDAKTGFITVSTYEDRHADMGDDEAKPIKGKITYTYTATDDHGNWTSRTCTDNGESWTETRTIKYY